MRRCFWMISALLLGSGSAHALDCGKAATGLEKAVCASPDLMVLDKDLSSAYGIARSAMNASERKELAADCKEQLLRQKRERGYGDGYDPKIDSLFSETTIAESMSDFGRWAIYYGKALVLFDAYEVGSYAEGPYKCEFPMARLKTLAVNPNPLL
jgi:hypothetical protein